MIKERILIIDDNLSHVKLEKLALAEKAYYIETATNADEALKVLEKFKPHLILMDVQLPGMNGLDLARQLKADTRYSDINIIAITAYGMKGDKELALAAGCDGYITKPIDVETFPEEIAQYLSRTKIAVTEK